MEFSNNQLWEKRRKALDSNVYSSPLAQVRAAIHRYQKSLDAKQENPTQTAIEEIEKI